MPETVVVFDTTVLSNLASVDQIDLLRQLYSGRALTTLMVVEELKRGQAAGYAYRQLALEAIRPFDASGWIEIGTLEAADEQSLYTDLRTGLGAGEASCLALAAIRGLTLATDDYAARRESRRRSITLTGTLGVLVRAIRENRLTLSEGNALLARMITLRYRAPVERLDDYV